MFVEISVKESMTLLWCNILECYRSPDAPEVLRLASADALCVAGVPLMSQYRTLPSIMIRYYRKSIVNVVCLCMGWWNRR